MAIVNNQANVSYSYTGARAPVDADSNLLVTNVLDSASLMVTKTPLSDTYIPGNNHSFVVRVENTGTETIENVVLQDNLGEIENGETTTSLMNYVSGSGYYSLNGGEFFEANITGVDPLVVNIGTLAPGDVYIFAYTATTLTGTGETEITNTVTASGDADGSPVSANDTSTITEGTFANVSVQKFGSDANITVGEDFSYSLVLTNTGNTSATDIVVTDTLPAEFSLESVTYTDSTGLTSTLDPSDYSVSGNTLTIPSASSTFSPIIPAGENIVFTLSGRFTNA